MKRFVISGEGGEEGGEEGRRREGGEERGERKERRRERKERRGERKERGRTEEGERKEREERGRERGHQVKGGKGKFEALEWHRQTFNDFPQLSTLCRLHYTIPIPPTTLCDDYITDQRMGISQTPQ